MRAERRRDTVHVAEARASARRWSEFRRETGIRRLRNDSFCSEEVRPCGRAGEISWHYYPRHEDELTDPQLADVLVAELKPWRLLLWEPLPTKAPGPHLALPFCCYLRSVIFYHRPYLVWPYRKRFRTRSGLQANGSDGHFFEWDHIETRLGWEAQILYRGDRFKIGGGRVLWRQHPETGRRGWWMRHWAEREREDRR